MLFVWIALWVVAIILLLADPRSSINRRLSAVALCGGAGALAVVLDLNFIPYLHSNYSNIGLENTLYRVQTSMSLLSYYGVPYFFLIFAMAYRPLNISLAVTRTLPILLLLPILACLLFTPGYTTEYPVSHTVIVWWAVPYFVIGTLMILFGKARQYSKVQTHYMICLAVLPPALFCMLMSYVLPSMGLLGMWKYNTWFVSIGVSVFFIGLFTYGFLGVRVLIDRRRLDSTLRAVTSGTAILHHAIKNDVGKVRLFTDKIKAYAEATNQPELLEDISVVQNASMHIQDMISRVHRRTEDLVIRPVEVDLGKLLMETLKPHEPLFRNLQCHMNIPEGWHGLVDPAQVGEALNNLVTNAIDAMKGTGHLFVSLKETKRELIVEVRDTGPGMDKVHSAKALEPFYSTKRGKDTNFGLGLPYAYYVMRRHGGSLHIRSKLGVGTRVYLTFSKRSIKATRIVTEKEIASIAVQVQGSDAHG